MQDEKERGTELDYCDLDPTKICDNCCKCIDSGKDYEDFQIELTDSISTLDEIMELPFDDDLFADLAGGGEQPDTEQQRREA